MVNTQLDGNENLSTASRRWVGDASLGSVLGAWVGVGVAHGWGWGGGAPGGGSGAHREDQRCPVLDLGVAEPGVGEIDSVDRGGLDVAIEAVGVEVLGDDAELFAAGECE